MFREIPVFYVGKFCYSRTYILITMIINVAVYKYTAEWTSRRKPLSHSSLSKMEAKVSTEKLVRVCILEFFIVRRSNQKFPSICWHLSTKLHGVISRKTVILTPFQKFTEAL